MFANQAKNVTCQKVNRIRPSTGTPVHIFSFATVRRSSNDRTPRQHGKPRGQKHEQQPRRSDLRKPGNFVEPEHGEHGHHAPDHKHRYHPRRTVGIEVIQTRHGHIERNAHRRGRHGNHRPRQKTKHQGVDDIVHEKQVGTGNLPQAPIQIQPGPRGDGRTQKSPRQHGHQIAHKQAKQQIARRYAMRHEKRADHEFGARDMLARIQPDEPARPPQAVLGDRLPVKLVDRIEAGGQGAFSGRTRHGICFNGKYREMVRANHGKRLQKDTAAIRQLTSPENTTCPKYNTEPQIS